MFTQILQNSCNRFFLGVESCPFGALRLDDSLSSQSWLRRYAYASHERFCKAVRFWFAPCAPYFDPQMFSLD